MALRERRDCDVFGTYKDVKSYVLTLREVTGHGPGDSTERFACAVDLSDRALERAIRLLKKATTPPTKRNRK